MCLQLFCVLHDIYTGKVHRLVWSALLVAARCCMAFLAAWLFLHLDEFSLGFARVPQHLVRLYGCYTDRHMALMLPLCKGCHRGCAVIHLGSLMCTEFKGLGFELGTLRFLHRGERLLQS